MLPVIIGGLIVAAITAIAMTDEKKCDELQEDHSPENIVPEKASSETIKEFRDQIDETLAELKSII
jgi:hypothetical protein